MCVQVRHLIRMSIENDSGRDCGLNRRRMIKYMYNIGLQQSHGPEPLCSIALLSFHDSAELFLHLSSEYLNSGGNDLSFMKYFDFINQKLPDGKEIAQKESMRRLNKARVSLKHNGTLPAKIELDAFRSTISFFFFEENCRLIFGMCLAPTCIMGI